MDAQTGDAEVVDFGRRTGDDFEDCIPKLCVCVQRDITRTWDGKDRARIVLCEGRAFHRQVVCKCASVCVCVFVCGSKQNTVRDNPDKKKKTKCVVVTRTCRRF
jgi:hypothetical protein